MSYQYSIQPFLGGFYIDIISQTIATLKIEIAQYELSRNNIRFKDVKSVKTRNDSGVELYISSGGDSIELQPWMSACLPFNGSTSDLKMVIDFKAPFTRRRVLFYYENKPSYWFITDHPL